jgi:7-cyano-7-deazaguanine synthase
MSTPVVVLFSGGQDSTTCLAWAMREFGTDDLHTVNFNYGQRHAIEQACAQEIHDIFGLPNEHQIFDLPILADLAGGALTNPDIDVELHTSEDSGNQFAHKHGLPSTFVPGRNMLFLTVAAAWAAQRGIYTFVTGVCEEDASGYPDCRGAFIHHASLALSAALDDRVFIHTPLIHRSKAQTWDMADDLGIVDTVVNHTHTCYNGNHSVDDFHEWGYGCSECPACIERKNGYDQYMNNKLLNRVS